MRALPLFQLCAYLILLSSCGKNSTIVNGHLSGILDSLPPIQGKTEYLASPYVTAGDRVYAVGHQNGTFPDLGWHVPGEMGGIWNHPIKLLDGFSISITDKATSEKVCLAKATSFVSYPIASLFNYDLSENGLKVKRVQFVPDGLEGMVVAITVENESKTTKNLTIGFTAMVDLMPVWISDSIGIADGEDELTWDGKKLIGRDKANPWFVVIGTDQENTRYREGQACPQERKGLGKSGILENDIKIRPGESSSIHYYISGSYQSEAWALGIFQNVSENPVQLLTNKWARYQEFSALGKINVPDSKIMEMYEWMRYNSDWLIRDVPEIGRGMSAGIPDFPWWFGTDNCYTLQALLSIGWHEEVKSTLELIIKLSQAVNDNGRVMHEASTNGVVFNPGNLNETPHFIFMMWEYYNWTGDRAFIEKHYDWVKRGMKWIEEQDADGNMYPDGPGMMEIHGLHSEMVDVVAYTQQAFQSASQMALMMGDENLAIEYQTKADLLKTKINTEWWVASDNSFADFRATKAETIQLIKAAMVRADTINKPWSKAELENKLKSMSGNKSSQAQGHVVHHNWVVNTPMEMGIADRDLATKALQTARKYTNRFGMYVTGMDRDENASSTEKWTSFSYVGAVMTLPTGVQAVAEARYGNIDEALAYMHLLHNSFSYAMPGSMYEVSPDYGQLVQAWSIYGVAVPMVNHFFGIQPNAGERRVTVAPKFPTGWDNVSIEQVKIGDNLIDFSKRVSGDSTFFDIKQSAAGWKINAKLPSTSKVTLLNGRVVTAGESTGHIEVEIL